MLKQFRLLALCLLGGFWGGLLPVRGGMAAEPIFVELPASGTARFVPTGREAQVPERFRLKPEEFPFETHFERMSGPVRISKVTFPSPVGTDIAENNTVHAHYFQPAGAGPFPGVVVLHILGGDFPLSQSIANSLARRGIAALFVKMPYYGERRRKGSERRMISRVPAESVSGMTQGVLDIRRAAAWLGSRPEVDPEQLGVTGISLGGIMSALSGAAEPRFKKVAIHLGGGNLAHGLWDLSHEDAEEFRRKWQADGGTRESFIAALAPIDPATHAHLLKGRKVLMVSARQDEIFSNASTLALWEATGKEAELIWLEDAGHYTAIKYIFREVERLGDFFSSSGP
jgi:cephalosporin-C deacetylase-like acetyl esterase